MKTRPLPVEALLPALAGQGRLRSWLRRRMEFLTGIRGVRSLLEQADQRPEAEAWDRILAAHGVTIASAGVVEAIPVKGPVIVIANHPFGAAEALALLSLCRQARPDVKFLANAVLTTIPELAPWLIPLEILSGASPSRNLGSLRQAMSHLKKGGLLGIFPAGAVSFFQWRELQVADPEWSPHVLALAVKSGAAVVPVRFAGRNPWWFQLAGMLHPLLRSALILPAFLSGRGRTLNCAAGPPIPAEILPAGSAADGTAWLRAAVEAIDLSQPNP